jgi:uncharacterized protein YxjI
MLKLLYQQKRKEGVKMTANVYTIENLLVGKNYYSRTLQGEIVSAEIHPKAVWYQGCETYLVEVAPNSGSNTWGRRTYRTVAVKTENN